MSLQSLPADMPVSAVPYPASPPRPAPRARSAAHIPALDGLRGIAVLLVMFHHFWQFIPSPLDGTARFGSFFRSSAFLLKGVADSGWVGVDLFFVLSGFLITGILLDTRQSAHYFRTFYIRRTLRIFPLYFGFLALLFLLPQVVVPSVPDVRSQLSDHAPWYWSYTVNFLIARRGWEATPIPIGHLWSLAIEEQFYLLWPAVVFMLDRPALKRACLGIVMGSLLLRCAAVGTGVLPTAIYVFTLTRIDALAVGALISLMVREPSLRISRAQGLGWIAAAAGVLVAIASTPDRFSPEGPVMQTVGYTALAIVFGASVAYANRAAQSGIRGIVLHLSPLRFFGRYSYGLYVFHSPLVFTLVWLGLSPTLFPPLFGSWLLGRLLAVAIATSCSVAVAVVSWHLFEKRILAFKDRFSYSPHSSSAPSVALPAVPGA